MTDRVMEHARSLAGLAPSTYEATLATTIAIGYPTGSLMPLGIGHQLLSYDIAWLFQPYLAFLAAMLGLSLYAVLERVIAPRGLRAAAAFLAAQPALLFGYGLWGGIKELSGAWLLALLAALLPWTLAERKSWRAVLPLAAACATVVCVLSLPGAVWLAAGDRRRRGRAASPAWPPLAGHGNRVHGGDSRSWRFPRSSPPSTGSRTCTRSARRASSGT